MITTAALMLPLGGCLLGGDKPEPALDIPARYTDGPLNPVLANAALPPLDWWREFHSQELTGIIEQARAANLDIAAAIARIVQADAQARIAGARAVAGCQSQCQRHTFAYVAINVGGQYQRLAWRVRARLIVQPR